MIGRAGSQGIRPHLRGYRIDMTVLREEFHHVVDQLPEEDIAPLLDYVRTHAHLTAAQAPAPVWDGPDFIGAFASGRDDISERSDELLLAEHPTGGSTRP